MSRDLKLKPDFVKKTCEEYLQACKVGKKIPFYVELAQLLDIDKDTLTDYEKRPLYAPFIKKVRQAQEIALSKKVGDENKPVGGIFLLKALHGYKDAQQIEYSETPLLGLPKRNR